MKEVDNMAKKGERRHGIDADPIEILAFTRICNDIMENTHELLENDPEFTEMLENIEHEGIIRLAGLGYGIVSLLTNIRDNGTIEKIQEELARAAKEMMSGEVDESGEEAEYVPKKDYNDVMFG